MVWPAWVVSLVVSAFVSTVAILIRPKVKQPKPTAVSDWGAPTAESRPRPRIYGSMRVKSPNTLDSRDRSTGTRKIKVS